MMKLNVRRFDAALPYEAPNHRQVCGLRLQGMEAAGSEKLWVGLSHFLPGGGAGPDAGQLEKVYVVLEGEITLRANGEEITLGPLDSVTIPAQVERELINSSKSVCSMMVVMPSPATDRNVQVEPRL